jgi:hypothetical protein
LAKPNKVDSSVPPEKIGVADLVRPDHLSLNAEKSVPDSDPNIERPACCLHSKSPFASCDLAHWIGQSF